MGAVTFSIDKRLIELFTAHLPLHTFVETGTFKGETIDTLKTYFKRLYTIELSYEYFQQAKLKFKNYPHVSVLHGNSATVLPTLKDTLKGQGALYWLDAHWCIANQTAGELSQCPLLGELQAIGDLHPDSVIIIDDARLFLTAPPHPHEISHWPGFNAVVQALNRLSQQHYLMVWNDCILYFPEKITTPVHQFTHQTGIDWLTVLDKSRDYDKLLVQLKEKEQAIKGLKKISDHQDQLLIEKNKTIDQIEQFMKDYLRTLKKNTSKKFWALAWVDSFFKWIKKSGPNKKGALLIDIDRNPLVALFIQSITALEKKFKEFKRTNSIEKLENEIKILRDAATARLKLIEQLHNQLNSNKYLEVSQLLDRINQFLSKFDSFQLALQNYMSTIELPTTKNALTEIYDTIKENLHQFKETYKKINIEHEHHIVHTYQHNTFKGRWLKVKTLIKSAITPKLGTLIHYPPRALAAPRYTRRKKKPAILPIISIITPTLNQGTFLERSILSVIEQSYPELQYIIQDGGSTDTTLDILNRYQPHLYHWESTKDQGQSHALNLGFKRATGEIMGYLNSDDLLLPGALEFIGSFFATHPEVDVVYGHRILIDEHDLEIGRWILPKHDEDVLSWADYIPQETLFWRRRIWEKTGSNIDESFRFAMDWDLILRFRDAGAHFVRLPRFLGAFRIHRDQKTSAHLIKIGEAEMQRLRERCHRRFISVDEINKGIRSYLFRHVIYHRLYRAGLLRY